MRLSVQHSEVGEFRKRYRWMVLVILGCFFALTVRAAQLQLIEGDVHTAQALRNITRRVTLATTRGVIRDSRGNVLAANRPSYNVYVVPEFIDMKETWPRVVQLMGLADAEAHALEERIIAAKASEAIRSQQVLLKVDVSREVVATLKTHENELNPNHRNGVSVVPVPVRYYPYGALGGHIIGYMREIDSEGLLRLEREGYRSGDRLGAIGVERRWESYLRGQRGWQKRIVGAGPNRDQEELEARYLDEPRRQEPLPGRDISLTLDIDLMKSARAAMRGEAAGAVVIVDVRTGRILAALSKPSFDLNVLSGGQGKDAIREAFRRMQGNPLKPILDKTISAAYPPGSTYKPFAAIVGLQDGLISPNTRVDCRGGYEFGRRTFGCTGVHRQVDLHEAIVQSCNTYFYALAAHPDASIDRLSEIGTQFGFGVKTGIGINPEARGRMPTKSWYAQRYKREGFRGGFTLLSAIGQGASTVTVLQLALSYAALANGGTLYQPQVVRSVETSDGTIVQDFPPRVRHMIDLDPKDLARVKIALREVVTDRQGTGYGEAIAGVDIAGKTGTSQIGRVVPKTIDKKEVSYFNRDHAWFAGYAPSTAPEIAIAVLIEHGGGGGKHAVPVAMQVVRDWQEQKQKRAAAEKKADERRAERKRERPQEPQ